MAIICLGAAIAPLDFAVNIAFPAMTVAFELGTQTIRWVAICYMLSYGGLMLMFGALGDRIGHLRIFKLGLCLAFFAFTWCAIAPTYALLLVGRVLQGVAIALTLSCAPALVLSLFPENRRTWALSAYGANFSLAAAAAPIIGGVATVTMGWPGVYWFRVPLVLIVLFCLRFVRFPEGASGHSPQKIAFKNSKPDYAAITVLSQVLKQDSNFAWINAASIVVQWTVFVVPLMVPYYLIQMAGWSAAQCGGVLAVWASGAVLGSLYTQRLVRVVSIGNAAFISAWIHIAGLLSMAFWPASVSLSLMFFSMLLNGVGLGVFQVAYADLVVASLPQSSRGVAGSLTQVTRTLGVISGALVWLWVFDYFSSRPHPAELGKTQVFMMGFHAMIYVCVVLCAAFFALSAFKHDLWFQRKTK